MPGIHLIYLEKGIAEQETEINNLLDSLSGTPDNIVKILKQDNNCLAAYKAYPEYPALFWENSRFDFYLEGRIYNRSKEQISGDLEIIADNLFYENRDTEKLSSWIAESDGDFLVWICEKKTGKMALFNDALARIPLYYYYQKGMLLISRDIRFITVLSNTQTYEKLALAQYLSLGHPLGKNTVWKNIYLLSPGTLLNFEPINGLKEEAVYTFNFSRKKYKNLSMEQNAGNLCDLFHEACSWRTGLGSTDILSLSGGFDSRCVGAGLASCESSFSSISFFKTAYHSRKEIDAAKKLASIFNSSWELMEIPEPSGFNALELIKIKNGLNNLGMTFILNFFKQIKDIYGSSISYFTGDGGDMVLPVPDPKPIWAVTSFKSLLRLIIESNYFGNQCFHSDDAAALAGIKSKTLFESVADYISDCPGNTWFEKYLHYKFYQRIPKVLVEAEDRNRYYFWTATPFYGIRFFDYAMNCPDEQKSAYELYRCFLKMLSPAAYHVKYSGYDYSPASEKFRIKNYASQIKWLNPSLLKKLKTAVKGVNRSFSPNDKASKILHRQIKTCPVISGHLDIDHLNQILKNIENYERNQIIELFTLISAMEYLSCEQSSLETGDIIM